MRAGVAWGEGVALYSGLCRIRGVSVGLSMSLPLSLSLYLSPFPFPLRPLCFPPPASTSGGDGLLVSSPAREAVPGGSDTNPLSRSSR